jgi:hypothetical protein
MLIPIKSNYFTSTFRPNISMDFEHYHIDQRSQAVADAMSWWELIKDYFNHFNHAKALAYLFEIVQCQQALCQPDLDQDFFKQHHFRMAHAMTELHKLIDQRYKICWGFDNLASNPLGQFWIYLVETDRPIMPICRQFPLLCVPKDLYIWRLLVDRFNTHLSPNSPLNLLEKIQAFSTWTESHTKSTVFCEIGKMVAAPHDAFRIFLDRQRVPPCRVTLTFLVDNFEVDRCYAD